MVQGHEQGCLFANWTSKQPTGPYHSTRITDHCLAYSGETRSFRDSPLLRLLLHPNYSQQWQMPYLLRNAKTHDIYLIHMWVPWCPSRNREDRRPHNLSYISQPPIQHAREKLWLYPEKLNRLRRELSTWLSRKSCTKESSRCSQAHCSMQQR